MVRIKRGNVARKRRKKILSMASGYKGTHSVLFRVANQQVMKALQYSYIGRKQKKRIFRRIWISRINIALRFRDIKYSHLINNCKRLNIDLNRKMLSQIVILDSPTFEFLIDKILHYFLDDFIRKKYWYDYLIQEVFGEKIPEED